ncbi:PepSY domain-containing protein [Alsobacter sp. R-9]
MLRRLHSAPGLLLALVLVVTAASGAALSLVPALDRMTYPVIRPGGTVADLAANVAARHPGVTRIAVRPNGAITAAFDDGDGGIEVIDPATGTALGAYEPSPTTRWLTNLHRSFLADDAGRLLAGAGSLAMVLLAVSGVLLLVRRTGSWRAMISPMRGSPSQRWHTELGRLAAMGLLLSALTGAWMSAGTFGLLPEEAASPVTVASPSGPSAPVASLEGLRSVDVSTLRDLSFPSPDDPSDVFVLRTTEGEASIDRVSGTVLSMVPTTTWDRVGAVVVTLHTGRGAWVLGLVLGLCASSVPAFAVTGAAIWWRRRTNSRLVRASLPAADADTVILVGSEGGATWGFAATLQAGLEANGHRVHVAPMNDLAPVHAGARRLLVLCATAGDGGAPASATTFLERLGQLDGPVPVAVLGFGDRCFPRFCQFAEDVQAALARKGWPEILPMKRVDRQSAQEFAAWGRDLGSVLGHELTLEHVAARPRTNALELVSREDFGNEVGAPVAILRFAAPARADGSRGRLPVFAPGDLVGVVPPGSAMPRFYSLASSDADGVLEICVRLRPEGLCSTFLHGLQPGDRMDAFIRENPAFRPADGSAPLILIGAGAGVGPLAGFVRANATGRPVHLYFGGRSPASDFLYEHEFAQHLAERRLTSLRTAFSRTPEPAYVQDRIAADAAHLRDLIHHGAQVLVCGGREMAHAVAQTLERVLHPLGTDLAALKASGRYVEDVY